MSKLGIFFAIAVLFIVQTSIAGVSPVLQNAFTTNNAPNALAVVTNIVQSFTGPTNGVTSTFVTNAINASLGGGYGGVINGNGAGLTNLPSTAVANVVTNVDMVRNFGAVSGQRLRYVTIATGSTSLSVSNTPFSPASVGMVVMLKECGLHTNSFTTTCAAYINPSNITLSAAVPQGVTNSTSYWAGPTGNPVFGYTAEGGVIGPDDTTAFQNAINLITNGISVHIHVPPGVYIINGPVQGTNNSQLYVPPVVPSFLAPAELHFYGDDIPVLNQRTLTNPATFIPPGATIYSTVPSLTGPLGFPGSMIDCRNFNIPVYSFTIPFNSPTIHFEKLRVEGCFDNGGCLLNLAGCWNNVIENVDIDSGYVNYCSPQPQNTNTWGLFMTIPSSDGTVLLRGSVIIDGFYNGSDFGEHTSLSGNWFIGDCWNALNTSSFYTNASATGIGGIADNLHGVDAEHNKYYVQNASGQIGTLNLDFMNCENVFVSDWTWPPVILNDPYQGLSGDLSWKPGFNLSLINTNPLYYPANGGFVQIHQYGVYEAQNTNNYANSLTANFQNLTVSSPGGLGIRYMLPSGDTTISDAGIYFATSISPNDYWILGKHAHTDPGANDHFFLYASTNAGTSGNYWLDIDPILGLLTASMRETNLVSATASNGQVPTYSSALGYYVPTTISGGGAAVNLYSNNVAGVGGAQVNGGGLTNVSAYYSTTASNINGSTAIIGVPVIQNPVAPLLQTNGSNPFINSPWQGINMYPNSSTSGAGTNITSYTLTNCPYIAIRRGIPTNIVLFGSINAIHGYTASNQTPEIRFTIGFYGNTIGFYTSDGNAQYAWRVGDAAGLNWSAWSITNVGTAGQNIYWVMPITNGTFGAHQIEFDIGAAVSAGLIGVYIPATNSFMNVQKPSSIGVVVGDSITDGAAGVGGNQLWPSILQDKLENTGVNIIPWGAGATGYTTNGGIAGGNVFSFRLTNYITLMNPQPNFIIWAGGINDITNNSSNSNMMWSAETNCYGLAASLIPNVKQIVIAPFSDSTPSDGYSVGVSLTTSNAASVYGLPVLYPQYTVPNSWVNGQWNISGSGNAPLFMSGNGPHPNIVGHDFYANMIYPFALTNLTQTVTNGSSGGSFASNAIANIFGLGTNTSFIGVTTNANLYNTGNITNVGNYVGSGNISAANISGALSSVTGTMHTVTVLSSYALQFGGSSQMIGNGSSGLLLQNTAGTGFSDLWFGIASGSWPQLLISSSPATVTIVGGDGTTPANLVVTGTLTGNTVAATNFIGIGTNGYFGYTNFLSISNTLLGNGIVVTGGTNLTYANVDTNGAGFAAVNLYSNNVAGVGGAQVNASGVTNIPSSAFAVTNTISATTNYPVNIGAGPVVHIITGANVCFNVISGTQGVVNECIDGNVQVLWPTNCKTFYASPLAIVGTNFSLQITNNAEIQFNALTNLANNPSLTNVWVSYIVR